MTTTDSESTERPERSARSVVDEACDVMESLSPVRLLPSETRQHVRAAQRELLMALRSVIDVALERLETTERRRERKATRVEVK